MYSEINKHVAPAKVGKLKISGELDNDDWKILKHDRTPMLYSLDLTGVTNRNIPDYQFQSKTWLTEITLPDSLETVGNRAFAGCSRLTGTLICPKSFKKFGEYSMNGTRYSAVVLSSEVSVGYHAFEDCTSLKTISSEFITSIASNAFSGCKSLEFFSTSDKLKSIGSWSFYRCSGLKHVTLNEGLEVIPEYVFSGCTSLTEIVFPYSLKNIYYQAFGDCSNITDVYAPWDEPVSCASTAFDFKLDNTTLHVPAGKEGKYAVASGWEKFLKIATYDPTGIDCTSSEIPIIGNEMYDIFGRKNKNASSGQIYIMNGKKYLM